MFIAHCRGVPFDEPTHNMTFESLRYSAHVRQPDGTIGIYLPLKAILDHGDIDSKLAWTLQFIDNIKLLEHIYRHVMKHCHEFCYVCRGSLNIT